MSRCSTPRLCAYSMALQTSRNRRRSLRSSSDRPRVGLSAARVEARDGLLEAVAADEPHGVVGPAVGVGAQAVDGDDPGCSSPPVISASSRNRGGWRGRRRGVEDLLERHLAVQLLVERDEDGAEAALGVGAQDAEPPAVCRRPAGGIARGATVGHRRSRGAGAKVGYGCLEVRVGNPIKALARGGVGRYGCEALIQIAAVLPQMQGDHRPTAARCSASRSPSATRCSLKGRALSRVQAWTAATSRASSNQPDLQRQGVPKRRLRLASAMFQTPRNRASGSAHYRIAPLPDINVGSARYHPLSP